MIQSTLGNQISYAVILVLTLAPYCRGEDPDYVFTDVTAETGLLRAVEGMHAHGAAWGDINNDGFPELYVGSFHKKDSKPNLFFERSKTSFRLSDQTANQISSRTTGVLFVDLDNDGDLDLYVASMPAATGSKLAQRTGHPLAGCSLFENNNGKFINVSEGNGACPQSFGGRSATALDYDGDGLLDLFVGEDPYIGYNGSTTTRCRLFKNLGELRFQDTTDAAGIPGDMPGLGVTAADMNFDHHPDLLIACTNGNHLLLNDGHGKFANVESVQQTLAWPNAKGDNMVCGVVVCDINNDGLPDICLGQHFERPWLSPVANRLYLHSGNKDGIPHFRDATEEIGLVGLPMKSPHIDLQDFDNDGQVDLYGSIVNYDSAGQPHPIIFRGIKTENAAIRFRCAALDVNDFPTVEDQAVKRTGDFFEKMIQERKIRYTAPGPVADFDRDGRLDIFMGSWWKESPSMLLRNETKSGNWLQVQVRGSGKVNRMGIGARVALYKAGQIGNPQARLGVREISIGHGYASGHEAIAHFGLGDVKTCDVEVTLPHTGAVWKEKGVVANQKIIVASPTE